MAALVVCGVWSLWSGRNARRHGRKVWEPGAAVRHVAKMLEDLAGLQRPPEWKQHKELERWKKPEQGWVKVNTDGAFRADLGSGSCGAVIRNHTGQVIAGAARWQDYLVDALMAEAVAAKEGLELAMEIGCDRVVLETDNRVLKNLLQDPDAGRSLIGSLCLDVIELSKCFVDFRVVWVSRSANSVAHCCAQKVSSSTRSLFWIDEIPDWLALLAAKDCNPAMM